MKIKISGIYESYPVVIEAETAPQQLPGLIRELLDVGIVPPERLSEFMKSVDARTGKTNSVPPTTDHQPPTTSGAPVCPVHRSEMRPGNKGGFYCSRKNADGTWCDERITQKKAANSGSQPKQQSFVTEQPVNQHVF